jgi:cation:H+ antiporter
MVESALTLAGRWSVPDAVVGTLILAGLTSIPNAYTGIRLGRAGRGAALVSETMNSNTINLVGGVAIPALFVTLPAAHAGVRIGMGWLLGMTVLSLVFVWRGGRGRVVGVALLALYAAFIAVQAVAG